MWAVQSGFIALPRSGVKSELERKAIDENLNIPAEKLTDEEVSTLGDPLRYAVLTLHFAADDDIERL